MEHLRIISINEERRKKKNGALGKSSERTCSKSKLEKDFGILAFDVLQKIGSTPVIQVE